MAEATTPDSTIPAPVTVHPEFQRKTISQTHKQALISYGSVAAFAAMLAGPLSHFFQTKEDGALQAQAIVMQSAQITDLKTAMDKNTNLIIEKMNDVVKPVAKDVDRHETRIVNLEFLQMNNKPRGR